MPATTKKKARASRGLTSQDITKMMQESINLMQVDHNIIKGIGSGEERIRSDKDRGIFMALVIRDNPDIQSHQRTHTLHVPQIIPVPEAHHVIRHDLPNKCSNPNIVSINRKAFKLPKHYIQYQSHVDPGKPSLHHFYDLKKNDIEWLVKKLSKPKKTSKILIEKSMKNCKNKNKNNRNMRKHSPHKNNSNNNNNNVFGNKKDDSNKLVINHHRSLSPAKQRQRPNTGPSTMYVIFFRVFFLYLFCFVFLLFFFILARKAQRSCTWFFLVFVVVFYVCFCCCCWCGDIFCAFFLLFWDVLHMIQIKPNAIKINK